MKKDILITKLKESCSTILKLLEGIDLEIIVYDDTGWRVKDIIGHIATWDREVVKSIEAYSLGNEYAIPNFDDDKFNQAAHERLHSMDSNQIVSRFTEARQAFIATIQKLDEERLVGILLYPWGDEHGNIATLVGYMTEHDNEHNKEIMAAIQRSINT